MAVTKPNEFFHDHDMFLFSFESCGQCMTRRRFAVKEDNWKYASERFFRNNTDGWFVELYGGMVRSSREREM